MACANAADDARFLQVSNDDTNKSINEMKNNNTKDVKINSGKSSTF